MATGKAEQLNGYDQFLQLHGQQLKALGVPEKLFQQLFVKLNSQCFDAFGNFGIVQDQEGFRHCMVTAENGIKALGDIFLVDHALTVSDAEIDKLREQMATYPHLMDRCAAMFGVVEQGEDAKGMIDQVLQKFWKFACCYHLSTPEGMKKSVWFVMDELGSSISHSGDPNVVCVPFIYIKPSRNHAEPPQMLAFSIFWPIQDLNHEDYVERDFCPWISTPIDRVAHLADWVSDVDDELLEQLTKGATFHHESLKEITEKGGIDGNCFCARDYANNEEFLNTRQSPIESIVDSNKTDTVKVFTSEDDPLRLYHTQGGLTLPGFCLVKNRDEADILWLSDPMKPEETTEFWQKEKLNSKRYVNQFPYEGVFCLKDNLSREVARCLGSPAWWMPSYDLEMQLPVFVGDYLNRKNAKEKDEGCCDYNVWIAKPNIGTRSAGHVVSNSLIRIIRSLEVNKAKVAQKYIERPLLYQGNFKFDMRFVVLVRSFEPQEIYVYDKFWCRVANKPHQIDSLTTGSQKSLNASLLEDPESHLTAMHLVPVQDQSEDRKFPSCEKMKEDLSKNYPSVEWKTVEAEIFHMLREVFFGLSSGQGGKMATTQARAIYGCDVMLEAVVKEGKVVGAQPKLLEVSFTPSNNAVNPLYAESYPSYVNDVFSCLFLGKATNCTRLL